VYRAAQQPFSIAARGAEGLPLSEGAEKLAMRKFWAVLAVGPVLSCGGQSNTFTPTPAPTPTPVPAPSPTPSPVTAQSCPPLSGVKAYVHLNVAPGEISLPDNRIGVIGGRMVLDSTFLFLIDGRAVPCNGEHPNCGAPGPQCEDPRGSTWRVLSGDYGMFPDLDPGDFEGDSSYAVRIPREGGFTHKGTAVYQVCPRSDYVTANGATIDTSAAGCDKITIQVK
jgi:hypothetical protein